MRRTFVYLILLLVLSACWRDLSLAGILLVQKDSSGQVFSWACEDGLLRMGTERSYTILDTHRQMIYIVMSRERRYMAFSVQDLRRQMEAMRGFGQFGVPSQPAPAPGAPSASSEVTYRFTGEVAQIAGYKARKVAVLRNGHHVADYWVSKAVAEDFFQACDCQKLEQMLEDLNSLGPMGASQPGFSSGSMVIKEGERFGFPLKTVDLETGDVTEVIKVEKKKFSRSYFKVPAGFERLNFGPGMGMPGRPF